MSYPELMNWDPMAEDYKKNFKINDDEDPLCLYITKIPSHFTDEQFSSLITDGGRTLKRVMLHRKNVTNNYMYGFVYFHTHEDALLTRNELNMTPPLYLQICFAKMKKDKDKNEYQKNTSKGRGMRVNFDGHKPVDKIEHQRNISQGRGMRINLDGYRAVSHKLKVTTGDSGRRVTVASPEKKSTELSGLKSPCQTAEKSKVFQAEVSPQKTFIQKSDVPALKPNPYRCCFCCGKKAEFACVTCKKPYCSGSCQSSDWITHKRYCKQIKENADLLIKAYRSYTEALDSSYLSESSNSDFEKCQEYSDVKKLQISLRVFEKVSVTNINSPSEFWVRLEKFSGDFSKVERELSLLQNHSSLKNISYRNNLLCCAVHKNKIYRGRMLKEESQNEAKVYLLDYGETATIKKSALFALPEELRKLPAQAVCCKLVDEIMKEDIDWNVDDILSFQLHATNKTYKAHIFRCVNDIYEVSLSNQDGNSVFSILAEAKKTVPCVPQPLDSTNDGVPPSVWSKLKPKTQVQLVPSIVGENDIWCYLLTNVDLDKAEIVATEELLKNYSGEDASLIVEEGDFAAGFSNAFKQFYRCVVLNRKSSSFSVRYIDYGNQEEITKVCTLSEQLIKKCSYIVRCVKPTSMSLEQLTKVLSNSNVHMTVKKISSDIAELVFNIQGEHIMYCYPCYPCNSDPSSKENEIIELEKDLEKCKQNSLLLNHSYKVKIVFYKSASEVYVQLMEDENKINTLFTDLNNYYNSCKSIRHIPVIGDIVSCKFSDGMWYRALVKEKKGDTFYVTFIDFGDEHEVHQNNIQVLSEKFKCPKFAVCVSMSEIKTEDLSQRSSSKLLEKIYAATWDMKVIREANVPEVLFSQKGCPLQQMIKNLNNNKSKGALKFKKVPIGITINVKFSFEDAQFVYLHLAEDIKALEQLCINLNSVPKVSVSGIPAVGDVFSGLFSDGAWYRISIEKIISPDMYKVYFLDFGNYGNLSVKDLRELPSDLFALPVYCIPVKFQNKQKFLPNDEKIYAVQTVSNNGEALEVMLLEDKMEDSGKAKTDKANIDKMSKKNMNFQQLPSGVNVDVKISYEDKFIYLHQTKDLKSVEDLCIEINKLSDLPVPEKPAVGNVYCGLCSDTLWYRVLVEEEVSPNKYKVLFLDFGNCENILGSDLRELPDDLLALPVYCIPVIVENRKDLNLSMEEKYAVRVTGMSDEAQTIKFLFQSEENSLVVSTENLNKNKMNKADLTFLKLPVGQKVNVKISYQDEKYTYFHQINDIDAINKLSVRLNDLSNLKTPKNPGKNDVYCGLFTDGLWYRVSIEEIVSPNMYKVLFLDYGNYEIVSGSNLRELPSDLFVLPVFCIPVTIQNREKLLPNAEEIYTVKTISNNGEVFVVRILEDKMEDSGNAKTDKANIDKMSKKNLKFQKLPSDVNVDVKISYEDKFMYLHQTKDLKSVEDLCIELNKLSDLLVPEKPVVGNVYCGLCSDTLWYRVLVEEEVSPNKYKVLFLDFGNCENVSGSDLRELPDDLLALPVYCIPVIVENRKDLNLSMEEQYAVRVTGMSDEAQTIKFLCHSEENSLIVSTENLNKNKMNKADLTFQKLPVDQNVSVKICHQDEKYVYLHQMNDLNDISELSVRLKDLSNLKTPKNPDKNDVYCGLFVDGFWYRVSIEETVSSNMYKVLFLDYGNYEIVSGSDLRELPSDLFALPIYCIPVIIKNREELSLSMEQIYVISVSGVVKDVQEVEFSLQCIDIKLPHISSLKKQQLQDGLNVVRIFTVDKDIYYCQLSSDDDDVLTMFKNLQKCSKEKISAELSVGDVLCAQSSDGCWYRASVLSNRNPSLKVFFLDYGNIEYVTSDCIKLLPKELLEQPTFAIPIKIENLQEIQNSEDLSKSLTVEKVKLLDENLHVVKVCLERESTVPGISKRELLAAEKDKKICEVESTDKMLSSVEESKRFTFDLCKSVPFNAGEQDIAIYSVDEDGSVFCAPFIKENIEANINLSQMLTEHCNHNGISFNDGSEPELTEMVLALYSEDKQWYRGTVIDKLDGSYFVNFVDYGNTEQLDLSSLCKMEKQFMELDVQAHMCTLTGFSVTEENKQKVYDELKKFVIFQHSEPLRAVVEVRDNDITLSIPTITSYLVGKKLVLHS